MSSRLQELADKFLVDAAPDNPRLRHRVFSVPSPRATAPKNGRQLLQWMIEEADEQHGLGVRPATVSISKADLKHLRYLAQWIDAIERKREQAT